MRQIMFFAVFEIYCVSYLIVMAHLKSGPDVFQVLKIVMHVDSATVWVNPGFIVLTRNFMGSCILSHFSCVQLFVTPWTVARQAPLSMKILQASILEWVDISRE